MMKTKMKSPEATVRRERELECLFEISQSLVSSPDLHASVHRIMDTLSEKMGMGRGTLTLLKPETGELIIEIAHGMPEEKKRRGKYKIGEGITGKVFETGEPAVVPQIGKEPLFLDRTKWRGDITKQKISFICVPIKIGRNVIGTFSVDRLFEEDISFEEDVRLLTILASMIAYAVKLNQVMEQEPVLLDTLWPSLYNFEYLLVDRLAMVFCIFDGCFHLDEHYQNNNHILCIMK